MAFSCVDSLIKKCTQLLVRGSFILYKCKDMKLTRIERIKLWIFKKFIKPFANKYILLERIIDGMSTESKIKNLLEGAKLLSYPKYLLLKKQEEYSYKGESEIAPIGLITYGGQLHATWGKMMKTDNGWVKTVYEKTI